MLRFSSLIATFQRLRNEGFGRIGRSAFGTATGAKRPGFQRSIRLAMFGGCLVGVGAGLFDTRLEAGKKSDHEWSDWEDETPGKGVKTADATSSSAKSSGGKSSSSKSSGGKIQQVQAEEEVDDAPTSDFMGVIGRGGHLAFPTFGRQESISPIEFMPYLLVDEHMFFTDFRGFLSNRAQGGGSLGAGYRYLDEPAHAWYGASFWYDIDNSTGYHFQDIGISLEAMIHRVELRGNFYGPVGPDQRLLSRVNSNARFNANQLLFDSSTLTGTAMMGFDVETGYSLPVDLQGVNDQLRGFVGYYHFTGSGVDDINGVKVRAELDMSSTVTTTVQFTHDKTFGSRVMAGMQFNLPWGNKNPASTWRRDMPNPFRYVERNYNVIVSQTSRFEDGVVARDANGNAYVVAHIDSAAGGAGTGGPTDPYASFGTAQAGLPGANLFFVHTGSTLNESIALTGGQSLIGEGTGAAVTVQGYGSLVLPTLNAGATPIIDGTGLPVGSDAITLTGAGNRVSGFTIQNFTGDGIVANGVSGALVENVSLINLGGDGVQLNGATGRVDMTGVAMGLIGGRGLFVNGGSANVNVGATFNQVVGDSIRVENTTGGTVSLSNVAIANGGGNGLSLINLFGDFFSNNLNINNVTGDGVYINQGTGTMRFAGQTKITDPGARGFVIDNSAADVTADFLNVDPPGGVSVEISQATGEVVLTSLMIDATNDRGLVIANSTDVTVSGGSITTVGSAAIDVLNSGVDIGLHSVSVTGGPVGIQILNSTGSLFVAGVSAAGSGGTIQNTAQAVLINNFGSVALQRMNLTNNVLGVTSTGSDLLSLNQLNISATTGGYAVDSLNDELVSIVGSTFTGNGVIGGGTIQIRADAAGTYQSQLINNVITDTVGTAVAFSNSGAAIGASQSITMQYNEINASRANESAVEVAWDGPLGVLFAMNKVNLTGSTMIGLDLHELSTTSAINATVGGNTMTMNGVNSIGFRTEVEDTSNLLFTGNTVTMNGGFGQAFWFDLADSGDVYIHSNTVNDNGGSGRGIVVQNIAPNSRLQIDNNKLLFNAGGASFGIRIDNGDPTVQLFSNVSNTITGAGTNFIIPVGKATGQVIINNTAVHAP